MSSRQRAALGLLVAALTVAGGAALRIHVALGDPNFDSMSADGMLRSDPALLYYFTERIVASGGLPPPDFRADPRVLHPLLTDVPVLETVGQEFLVAWTYLAFGRGMPLHVFCVWVMGIVASLTSLAVYGLTLELTRKVHWAALAACLYVATIQNYRTIGFILIREDLSLPLYALHLYLLARAFRVRTPAAYIAAAAGLVLALATWHAMTFIVAMEALVAFAWMLRTGENPFARGSAWLFPATTAALSLLVPVLRGKLFLLSPSMLLAASMMAAAPAARLRGWTRRGATAGALACLGALAVVSISVARWTGRGQADYGHVFTFLLAKIRYLGVLPNDPAALPFDARLLWQGPFVTATGPEFLYGLGVALPLLALGLALALPGWVEGRGDTALLLLAGFAALCTISAWLVSRTLILPGLIAPVLGCVALDRLGARRIGIGVVAAGVVLQAAILGSFLRGFRIAWYSNPLYNFEIASLVEWARGNLPRNEAVAGDFVHSTALLAHNLNPIVCQPKYESVESRRRFERFLESYFHGTPDDLARFARAYRCRYLLIDRIGLWLANAYIAGIPPDQPGPVLGTAAAVFMSEDPKILGGVPGFTLVYRSPPELRLDLFRVYRLEDGTEGHPGAP